MKRFLYLLRKDRLSSERVHARDSARLSEKKESVAFVGSRIWSGFPELRFICGKNRVSPGQMDPELFFSLAVRFDVYIARIITLPTVRLEK